MHGKYKDASFPKTVACKREKKKSPRGEASIYKHGEFFFAKVADERQVGVVLLRAKGPPKLSKYSFARFSLVFKTLGLVGNPQMENHISRFSPLNPENQTAKKGPKTGQTDIDAPKCFITPAHPVSPIRSKHVEVFRLILPLDP